VLPACDTVIDYKNPAVKMLKDAANGLQRKMETVMSEVLKQPLPKTCMPYVAKDVGSLQFWLTSYLWRALEVIKMVQQIGVQK